MAEQRLPIVNSDDGVWGDVLNQYIKKEHYDTGANNVLNGGHKNITVRPGTIAAGTSPIKLTSGPLMSTPEIGAIEFLDDNLYFTQTSGTSRKAVATYDNGAGGAMGDMYYRDAGGNFAKLTIGPANNILSSSNGVPAWISNVPTGESIDNLDGGSAYSVYGGAITINGGNA